MEWTVKCFDVQDQAEDSDWHIICLGDHWLSHDSSDGEKALSRLVWTVILQVIHWCPPESPLFRSSFWVLQLASEAKEGLEEREAGRSASWKWSGAPLSSCEREEGRGGNPGTAGSLARNLQMARERILIKTLHNSGNSLKFQRSLRVKDLTKDKRKCQNFTKIRDLFGWGYIS